MLKKKIKYTDYNGVERNEDFYFNLNKAELMEMELTTEGGLAERTQRIIDTQDTPKIVEMFKDLILRAYGEKSEDGKAFIKSYRIGSLRPKHTLNYLWSLRQMLMLPLSL